MSCYLYLIIVFSLSLVPYTQVVNLRLQPPNHTWKLFYFPSQDSLLRRSSHEMATPVINPELASASFHLSKNTQLYCTLNVACRGWTPLMCLAMCRSRFHEFQQLICTLSQEEVNSVNEVGWSALHLACVNSHQGRGGGETCAARACIECVASLLAS
jgi:hypothetical protein